MLGGTHVCQVLRREKYYKVKGEYCPEPREDPKVVLARDRDGRRIPVVCLDCDGVDSIPWISGPRECSKCGSRLIEC